MTVDEIKAQQARQAIRFEIAAKIRELLDEAAEKYGREDWESDGLENEIGDMVFE